MEITNIYCDTQQQRCADIAVECGMHYGAQLPAKNVYHSPYFTDQDWKKPNREKYVAAVSIYTPSMATVLDWEREAQLPEVLEWAEAVVPYTQSVVLIPKVHGGIARLPRTIGGKRVILGFSVPTSFGGTQVSVAEFRSWPIHLLGGSPKAQHEYYRKLTAHGAEIVSADGNMASKMAIRFRRYWEDNEWKDMPDQDPGAYDNPELDNRYIYFRISIENILSSWHDVLNKPIATHYSFAQTRMEGFS